MGTCCRSLSKKGIFCILQRGHGAERVQVERLERRLLRKKKRVRVVRAMSKIG